MRPSSAPANTGPDTDVDAGRGHGPANAERYRGTAVNPLTFLATDYLNHFNEPIMLIDMIAGMPECLEELVAWEPKSYVRHFLDSSFKNRDLCIEAYAHVDPDTRERFDDVVAEIDDRVLAARDELSAALASGDPGHVAAVSNAVSEPLRDLIDRASGIINGVDIAAEDETLSTAGEHIDAMQAAVDALFD